LTAGWLLPLLIILNFYFKLCLKLMLVNIRAKTCNSMIK